MDVIDATPDSDHLITNFIICGLCVCVHATLMIGWIRLCVRLFVIEIVFIF